MPCGLRRHISGIDEELVETGQIRLPTRFERRRCGLGPERLGFLGLEGKVADIGKVEHVRTLMRYIVGLAIMLIRTILDIPASFPSIFGCILLRLGILLRMGIRAASIVILLRCRI